MRQFKVSPMPMFKQKILEIDLSWSLGFPLLFSINSDWPPPHIQWFLILSPYHPLSIVCRDNFAFSDFFFSVKYAPCLLSLFSTASCDSSILSLLTFFWFLGRRDRCGENVKSAWQVLEILWALLIMKINANFVGPARREKIKTKTSRYSCYLKLFKIEPTSPFQSNHYCYCFNGSCKCFTSKALQW